MPQRTLECGTRHSGLALHPALSTTIPTSTCPSMSKHPLPYSAENCTDVGKYDVSTRHPYRRETEGQITLLCKVTTSSGNAGRQTTTARLQPEPEPLTSVAPTVEPPCCSPAQFPKGRALLSPAPLSCVPVATLNLTQRAAFNWLNILVNNHVYLTHL